MPAKKGNTNGAATWTGQFEPAAEPRILINSKVPRTIAEQFEQLLEPGESKSAAVVAAIELLIRERSKKKRVKVAAK